MCTQHDIQRSTGNMTKHKQSTNKAPEASQSVFLVLLSTLVRTFPIHNSVHGFYAERYVVLASKKAEEE